MDANKAQKLKDISYKVTPSCGTCKHFVQKADEDFGDCQIHEYEHLKHTGKRRKLSVVRYGHCEGYEVGDVGFLHGFVDFMDRNG